MSEQIKDGSGSGYLAEVDSSNKLMTRAVTEGAEVFANKKGNAYNLNTGIINLTDASRTSVIYLKNNEDKDLIISSVVIGVFNSANGDGLDMLATFVRNPTDGDIITNMNNVSINSNRNYGSTNTLSADVYKGATGETAVTGTDHILIRISEQSRNFITINEFLPKGSTFAVDITPPTGNDGMNVYVAVISYLDT
jgi:hypothetical protein